MLVYPATFEKDGKYILVKFPDVPGAFTEAETMEEAFIMAEEVLGAMLETYTDFPIASTIKDLHKTYPDKDIALISIDLVAYRRKYHSKTIRKSVTVPEWLNDLAEIERINFSQTLTEALKNKLGV